jgi:AbrB family looped-hinge helix DNA binding protein
MSALATTKMSSRGQVVIPEEVREDLGLNTGTQFIVMGEGDVVILKRISAPGVKEFDRLIRRARQRAKEAGLRRSDISKAITKVRREVRERAQR